MRIKHTINPKIYEDTDGHSALLGLSDSDAETILDGFESQESGVENITVSAGTFTVPISGGPAVVHGFWIRGSGDFDLSINGGTAIQVRLGKATSTTEADTARVFMEAMVTSLEVTPVTDLRIAWALWGDPTV